MITNAVKEIALGWNLYITVADSENDVFTYKAVLAQAGQEHAAPLVYDLVVDTEFIDDLDGYLTDDMIRFIETMFVADIFDSYVIGEDSSPEDWDEEADELLLEIRSALKN